MKICQLIVVLALALFPSATCDAYSIWDLLFPSTKKHDNNHRQQVKHGHHKNAKQPSSLLAKQNSKDLEQLPEEKNRPASQDELQPLNSSDSSGDTTNFGKNIVDSVMAPLKGPKLPKFGGAMSVVKEAVKKLKNPGKKSETRTINKAIEDISSKTSSTSYLLSKIASSTTTDCPSAELQPGPEVEGRHALPEDLFEDDKSRGDHDEDQDLAAELEQLSDTTHEVEHGKSLLEEALFQAESFPGNSEEGVTLSGIEIPNSENQKDSDEGVTLSGVEVSDSDNHQGSEEGLTLSGIEIFNPDIHDSSDEDATLNGIEVSIESENHDWSDSTTVTHYEKQTESTSETPHQDYDNADSNEELVHAESQELEFDLRDLPFMTAIRESTCLSTCVDDTTTAHMCDFYLAMWQYDKERSREVHEDGSTEENFGQQWRLPQYGRLTEPMFKPNELKRK
jgi:hypothetical protein